MENSIAEIHEQVYAHLVNVHLARDKNLKFTLRQVNRAGRLDQGYWFNGNENYLTFSFWKGLDWRNKTSNIYFQINLNGTSSLDFVSFDDEKKIEFFTEVAEALGMKQMSRVRTGDKFEHWVKNYRGNDYIEALDIFIKQDKKIIDAFIKSSDVMFAIFEPIDNQEFELAKKRIENVRKKRNKLKIYQEEYKNIKSIVLKELELKNISLFSEQQNIEFNRNLTCFIGLNGTGKTSILRSLVLSFTGFEQNEGLGYEDNLLLTPKLTQMMRILGIKNGQPEYPKEGGFAEITYLIEGAAPGIIEGLYKNKVLFSIDGNGVKINDENSEDSFKNIIDDRYKCLFLAFPQLLGERKDRMGNTTDVKLPHIKDAISMLNNEEDNRFRAFADWLRNLNRLANDKQARGENKPIERDIIEKVFSVISKVTNIPILLKEIVVTEDGSDPIWVCLGENSTPIILDLVSQGFNNVFGWIGYFMKRLKDVTNVNDDFTETPAIVLVDEIDTYLHPAWQSKIMAVLIDEFPKVQFVITTHSPYVVGSIPKDKISIYICKTTGQSVEIEQFDDFNTYGANLDRLSEEVFGTPNRFVSEIRTKMQELSSLIEKGNLTKAKEFLANDFSEIDRDDPELERKRTIIKTKELLAR